MMQNNIEFVWFFLEAVKFLSLLFSLLACALMLHLGIKSFLRKLKAVRRERPVCARGDFHHEPPLTLALRNDNRSGERSSV